MEAGFSFSTLPCGECSLVRREHAEVSFVPVRGNLGEPIATLGLVDTEGAFRSSTLLVVAVFDVGNRSQVGNPIIVSVAVDMIDIGRPCTVNEKPDQPMALVTTPINTKGPIPLPIEPTSDFPGKG
jgi:hypothetical protein